MTFLSNYTQSLKDVASCWSLVDLNPPFEQVKNCALLEMKTQEACVAGLSQNYFTENVVGLMTTVGASTLFKISTPSTAAKFYLGKTLIGEVLRVPLNCIAHAANDYLKNDLINAKNISELVNVSRPRAQAQLVTIAASFAIVIACVAGAKKLAEWRARKMTKTETALLCLISLTSFVGCQLFPLLGSNKS